jgi:hypothetical protein
MPRSTMRLRIAFVLSAMRAPATHFPEGPLLQAVQRCERKARGQFRARSDDGGRFKVQVGVAGGMQTAFKDMRHGNDAAGYQPRDSNSGTTRSRVLTVASGR